MSGTLLAEDRQELFAGRLGPAAEMDCRNLAVGICDGGNQHIYQTGTICRFVYMEDDIKPEDVQDSRHGCRSLGRRTFAVYAYSADPSCRLNDIILPADFSGFPPFLHSRCIETSHKMQAKAIFRVMTILFT
jgi:hypothetical protein